MKREDGNERANEAGMELKYCEHCGGLWVRPAGAGVYCKRCVDKVDELPTPKKRPGRVKLPLREHTRVEDHDREIQRENLEDYEAVAGGVA